MNIALQNVISNLRYRRHLATRNNHCAASSFLIARSPCETLAAASLYRQITTTIEPTKEEASIEMDYSNLDRKVPVTKKLPSQSDQAPALTHLLGTSDNA